MSIIVGSARISENGTVYGEAGDQKQTSNTNDTSGEVSMQTMYTHSKGWYILRPISVSHADKIAERAKTGCNNKHIGYSQGSDSVAGRLGVVNYGIDTTKDVGADCSSFARECAKEGTGKDPGNFTTDGEKKALLATGLFEDEGSYTSQSKTPVYNGDILVTKTQGHTVIVVSGSPRSSSGSTSSSSSGLDVDGEIGKKTVTRWQEVMGQTGNNIDGFIDGQDSGQKKYWTSILSSVCKWSGGSSAVVKKWQKYLIGKGYSCGSSGADGELGKNTAKASQQFLIANGYSCGSKGADSYFGKESAKGLQMWLNDQK